MSTFIENVPSEGSFSPEREPSARQIYAELAEILRSTPFRASKQSQQLLRYIVEQTLTGKGELLKERVIGAEVFGRPADYDTSEDPIVRSRATDVRKRLAQYYVGEGARTSVRIEISPGAYQATFSGSDGPNAESSPNGSVKTETVRPVEMPVSAAISTTVISHNLPVSSGTRPRRWRLLLVVTILMTIAIPMYWISRGGAINLFWQPLLGNKPVFIYTGAIQAGNPIITVGDLFASTRVAALLSRDRQNLDNRSADDITFDDLRQSPSVLIGGFNNRWTLLLNDDVPFLLVADKALMIEERSETKRQWVPVYSPDGKLQTDYAVVTRLVSSRMGQPLIAIAGITDSGTRAAAEFVSSPEQIKTLALAAPRGWEKRNMQFVLQTNVVNNIPSTSTLVAIRYW